MLHSVSQAAVTFPFRLCLQAQTGIAWRKLFLPCCMVLGAKRVPRLLVHLPVHLAHISPPAEEAARSVWRPVLGEARKKDQWSKFTTAFFFLPFSCWLSYVKPICASLPALKPPLGFPSLSLSLAPDVSSRHMVAGLSPSLLIHRPLLTMAAAPEGHLGLKGEMSPPFPHSYILQTSSL